MTEETNPTSRWFEALADASLDALLVLEPVRSGSGFDVICRYANAAAGEFLGRPHPDLIGRYLSEMIRPIHGQFRADLAEVVLTGERRCREIDTLPENVRATRVEYRITPVDSMLAVSVLDRSRETQAEAEAAVAQAVMDAGSTTSFAGCAVLRPIRDADNLICDVVFEHANDEIGRILGRPVAEVIGRPFYSEVYSGLGRLVAMMRQCEATGHVVELLADTRAQPMVATELEIRLVQTGELMVAHIADVSARRAMANRLIESEARFRTIFETTTEGVALVDANGVVQFANPAFASLVGDSPIGRPIERYVDPVERGWTQVEALAIRRGERVGNRHRVLARRADYTNRWVDFTTDIVRDEDGTVLSYVVFASDVDDAVRSDRAIATLAAALSETERRERARIADELHDGPVQSLAVATIRIGSELERETIDRDSLRSLERALISANRDLRGLLTRLAPTPIDSADLIGSIRRRVSSVVEHSSLVSDISGAVDGVVENNAAALLVQFAQEATVNTLKHADATSIRIAVDRVDGHVVMNVSDDGVGFEGDAFLSRSGHRGLANLREQVRAAGGELSTPPVEAGFLLRLELPLGQPHD